MILRQQRPFIPVLAMVLAALIVAAALAWRGSQMPAPAPRAAQAPSSTDQLIWSYQEALGRDPDDVGALANLGAAFLQKARETADPAYYSRADEAFGQALRRDPQHLDALVGKGTLALARHRFRDALALGEQARQLSPTTARIYGVIADAQVELGMYAEAIASVQIMVDLRPDLASYSRVAYLRELHGDLEGAVEAMDLAVRAGGPTRENTEWTRVQLGNLYFARGDLDAAESQYRRSLAMLPDYVYATAGLARVQAARGDLDGAAALYREAIARVPAPEFVIGLGETLLAAGRDDEAGQQFALVRAMQQLAAAEGADVDLELARFEADHGDPATALLLAQAAYERRPSVGAADTLAWALYANGRFDEARPYAEAALRLGSQDALSLYHAGMIARAQGDTGAAEAYLDRAFALNPHFSPLYGRP